MDKLNPDAEQWLLGILTVAFTANKHIHSHQDEVYRVEKCDANYYLKISATLRSEHDNLQKLKGLLNVPKVIRYFESPEKDYLLISELPGKNLAELSEEWSDAKITDTFAQSVKQLHSIDASRVFSEATDEDVLVHGDMALPNIIISEQQHIGYIDFGQLSFGSPESDLVDSICSLRRNGIDPAYGEIFLEKYGVVEMTPKIVAALKFRHQPPETF